MKNTIITIVKIVLFGVFLYDIGTFDLIHAMKHSGENLKTYDSAFVTDPPFEERMAKERILTNLVVEKTEAARKKGKAYSLKDYFTDFLAIKAKEVELKYHVMGFQMMQLLAVRDNAWRMQDIDQTELEYWQDEIEKRYPDGHGLNSERDKTPTNWWHILSVIGTWLLKKYLLTLPLACILFLLWNYEATKRWRVQSPFRLLLCTLGFPYFIIRQWIATVEMKRTKQYVTDILSKDELAAIKAFALSTGRLDEFRAVLQLDGRVIRHSYSKVIIWLLAFNIVCVASFGYTLSVQQQIESSKVSERIITYHGNHVQPPPLEYAHWNSVITPKKKQEAWFEKIKKPKYFLHKIALLPQEWYKRIDHVPLMNIQSRQTLYYSS